MMDPNEIYKRVLIKRLGAIRRSCYIDVFIFVLDRKIDYTVNNNGVFFNLSALPHELIRDIDTIIKKYESKS